MKVETNVKFSDNVHKFLELITSVDQQQLEDLVYSCFVICTKKKESCYKKMGHTTDLIIIKMKDLDFNKLKAATTA